MNSSNCFSITSTDVRRSESKKKEPKAPNPLVQRFRLRFHIDMRSFIHNGVRIDREVAVEWRDRSAVRDSATLASFFAPLYIRTRSIGIRYPYTTASTVVQLRTIKNCERIKRRQFMTGWCYVTKYWYISLMLIIFHNTCTRNSFSTYL